MLLLLVFKQTNITNTILFVISLDRQKKKERVLIGEELQIRFSLRGNTDADVLCDMTRPLGTFLAEFEHDPDGEWSRLGLMPLREALHSNRWKQPAPEKSAGEFLAKKYLTGDPVRIYAAFRIWNGAKSPAGCLALYRRCCRLCLPLSVNHLLPEPACRLVAAFPKVQGMRAAFPCGKPAV